MKFEAKIIAYIEAEDRETAYELALEAARQVELRLGTGPHSVAPYLPGKDRKKAAVTEAELELLS